MPNAETTVSRRRVLIGAAALALAGGTVSACSTPPQRDPALDALQGQLQQARNDSQLAATAASAAPPKLAPALTAVASIRDAHAQALSDELSRIGGAAQAASSTASSTPAAATGTATSAVPTTPPTPQDVITALQQSADSAAHVASGLSGYPAGLLASIAAACTAAFTVTLGGRPS
ncbi:hypothetical protein [Mycobacterium sp. OTB74]|uniref:hypothetical protein n=1 Tax=Mycobacterium sp. OTB74 TaxID=1853452 RepID=UPI002475E453|nr:hypothetical protein [Mycobacterium sp. OTB74]